jgi:Xaa-Pro aminopeptidase
MTYSRLELGVPRPAPLSRAERDRRWAAVRAQMRSRGLDVLVVWGDSGKWDSKMANVRYLAQIGGNGEVGTCVFPLDGEPTILLWSDMMTLEWLSAQDWVADLRSVRVPSWWSRPVWSEGIAGRLTELGLGAGRVGMVGLEGTEVEGDIPYATFHKLQQALPEARFENATDIVESLRLAKSDEELAQIEHATAIGEAAADVLQEMARPGVPEADVYAAMVETMLRLGSESPIMFLWGAGQPNRATRLTFARGRSLALGDVIDTEYSPRFNGYYSHLQRPAALGEMPPLYGRLFEASVASYEAGLEDLRPGRTVADLCQTMMEPIRQAGFSMYQGVLFHGIGLGWERPYGNPDSTDATVLRPGMLLAFEPGAATPDLRHGVHVGEPIVVTADGWRSLSARGRSTMVPVL